MNRYDFTTSKRRRRVPTRIGQRVKPNPEVKPSLFYWNKDLRGVVTGINEVSGHIYVKWDGYSKEKSLCEMGWLIRE